MIEQLKFWPEADHDDGPDSLEKLWKRRRRVDQLLAEVQRGRASPFPNWPA